MTFLVRFWGVRGSLASPGPHTAAVGGNTSAVEVRCDDTVLVLDAGTGLRALGDALVAEGVRALHLLLSHHHWDHIQGLPFFVPAYLPGTSLQVLGPAPERLSLDGVLHHQMTAPVFPVRHDQLGASVATREVDSGERFPVGPALVEARRLHHPGGVLGYRIEHEGKVMVYATDFESGPAHDDAVVELAREADVLIFDAQYTPEEIPSKRGWGHSTWQDGTRIARAARVKQLLLFHHDPRRSDEDVGRIEELAREELGATTAAREGLTLDLSKAPPSRRPVPRAA